MKLIDKSALVAEIEKAIKIIYAGREYVGIPYGEECIVSGLQKAEDIINTLEVKEVDLEKEIDSTYRNYVAFGRQEIAAVAKHFFELGLRMQTETNITFKYNIGESVREYKAQK